MVSMQRQFYLIQYNPSRAPGVSAGGTAHGEGSRLSQNAVCWLRDTALPGEWKQQTKLLKIYREI